MRPGRYWLLLLAGCLLLALLGGGCKGRFVPMDMKDARLVFGDYEKAVYDFLINDVKQADSVMTVEKIQGSRYALDLSTGQICESERDLSPDFL